MSPIAAGIGPVSWFLLSSTLISLPPLPVFAGLRGLGFGAHQDQFVGNLARKPVVRKDKRGHKLQMPDFGREFSCEAVAREVERAHAVQGVDRFGKFAREAVGGQFEFANAAFADSLMPNQPVPSWAL